MQSRTLLATINIHASLRTFGPLTILLLSIWVFSPLGSQSCLRILSTAFTSTQVNQTIQYVDTWANAMFKDEFEDEYIRNGLNPLYLASILSPPSIKGSSMDSWDNVRIPYLSNYENLDSNDWLPVPDPVPAYSSLLGIPLSSIGSGNATLSLESTYIGLDCASPTNGPQVSVAYIDSYPFMLPNNMTNGTFWSPGRNIHEEGSTPAENDGTWDFATDARIQESYVPPSSFKNGYLHEINQSRILFQSVREGAQSDIVDSTGSSSSDAFSIVYCAMSQVYVESSIKCSINDGTDGARDCAVTAQRPSQLPHVSSNLTMLSFIDFFSIFTSEWIAATAALIIANESSFLEYYLQNTSTSFILGHSGLNPVPASLDSVSGFDFGQRLGQLLNTYLLGSQTFSAVAGGQSTIGLDYISRDPDGLANTSQSSPRNTTATLTQSHEVYVCSWGWLAVLLIATFVMLTASLLAMWWDIHTQIPDILGYCSSLTRDAPYLNLPGGNTLDGLERTRLLKDYRITLGVVEGSADEDVGHIAVAPAGSAERPVKGKLYA